MIGQAISIKNEKFNIIILAGGLGTRMGNASEYIPKALTKLGEKRAIDYIIEKYKLIAHKFIIGISWHADLLKSYILGNYDKLDIEFSYEKVERLKNNAISTLYCLDKADSRYPTLITFCDLFMLDVNLINNNSVYYVTSSTFGHLGSFRHSLALKENKSFEIIKHDTPIKIESNDSNGLLGNFIFSNTYLLKSIIYNKYDKLEDLTNDIIEDYNKLVPMKAMFCKSIFEFGSDDDLLKVRKQWEII